MKSARGSVTGIPVRHGHHFCPHYSPTSHSRTKRECSPKLPPPPSPQVQDGGGFLFFFPPLSCLTSRARWIQCPPDPSPQKRVGAFIVAPTPSLASNARRRGAFLFFACRHRHSLAPNASRRGLPFLLATPYLMPCPKCDTEGVPTPDARCAHPLLSRSQHVHPLQWHSLCVQPPPGACSPPSPQMQGFPRVSDASPLTRGFFFCSFIFYL